MATADLDFLASPAAPDPASVDLDFGGQSGTWFAYGRARSIKCRRPVVAPGSFGLVDNPPPTTAIGQIVDQPAPELLGQGVYHSRTSRPLIGASGVAWGADAGLAVRVAEAESGVRAVAVVHSSQIADAVRTSAFVASPVRHAKAQSAGMGSGWQDAARRSAAASLPWARAFRASAITASPHADARAAVYPSGLAQRSTRRGTRHWLARALDRAVAARSVAPAWFGQGAGVFLVLRGTWQDGSLRVTARSAMPSQAVPDDAGLVRTVLLNFDCDCPFPSPLAVHLNFGVPLCEARPPALIVVPVRSVYVVVNNVTLRRVVGNIQIQTIELAISLDDKSWTWGFSATLPLRARDAVERDSSGEPVEVEASINGAMYRFMIESVSQERTFTQTALRITGRGLSAALDDPYAPTLGFTNTQARTAQQLMADVLTVNGVPLGWAVDWQIDDWLVPAGAYAHQGTYMSAISAVATAAGAYIQPHDTAQTLRVLARYPVAPWEWSGVTPDYELPAAVVAREGIEWLDKPSYNRVFVSGVGQGILADVRRTGSAGDQLAPMVADPLITAAAAGRQRGLSVLAAGGRQAMVSLRVPVLDGVGVIKPGKFVRYVDGGTTRLGLVRGVSLSSRFPVLSQTIGVETHV